MRITRIVETSIQVVSPLLTVGAAAAASCARAGLRAARPNPSAPSAGRRSGRNFIGFKLRNDRMNGKSKGVDIGLARADADRPFERGDENLAVADLAGARGRR